MYKYCSHFVCEVQMGFDPNRCHQIVQSQRANYPYLNDETAYRLIGTILANRRKGSVHITADFMPALTRCGIPLHQERGYAQVAADYFNQKGSLVKNGASYGIYKRHINKGVTR